MADETPEPLARRLSRLGSSGHVKVMPDWWYDPDYAVDQAIANARLAGAPEPDPEWRASLRRIATGEVDADEVIREVIEKAKARRGAGRAA
jgi:hypothetical protein